MENQQSKSAQRLFLEDIILITKLSQISYSQKKKYIENTCSILSNLAHCDSIEAYFNHNDEDIKFFIHDFLREIIKDTVYQQDPIEMKDYCSILFEYLEFFSLYYSHKEFGHVLFTYLIDIFDCDKPIYSCHLNSYEKFNELLYKNPKKFIDYSIGDEVDVLLYFSMSSENCNWVRGKVRSIEEDNHGECYYNIMTSDDRKYFQIKKDSIKIQKGGSMTPDWEWRISLKERDNVDVFDRGAWYPATILTVDRQEIYGIVKVMYKIGFRLYIEEVPDWKDYMKYWKKKRIVEKDSYGKLFFGDLQYEEHIPHHSKRIQKFQSCIKTQSHTDIQFCLDDFYLYHNIPDSTDHSTTNMIIARNFRNFCYCFALALKTFYDKNGYNILLSLFSNDNKEKNSLNSSGISTPTNTTMPLLQNSNINSNTNNIDTIYPALYTLLNSIPYFHRDFFIEESEAFISKCYDYFNTADHKQMRNIRKETIELLIQIVTYFEQNKSNPNYSSLSKLFLLIIYRLFKVNVFDKRLLAVKILNDFISTMKYCKEQITQFITDNNIVYEMFGPEGHMQFISKGIGIIEAMIKHNCFHEKDLEIIWTSIQKGDKESKLLIIKLIKDSIAILSHDLQQIIIKKITTQSKESIIAEEIDLLFNIAIQLSNGEEMNVIGLYMLDYLIKNVNLNDEEKFKKIFDNIETLMHMNHMYQDYIELCAKELKNGTCAMAVLKCIQLILETKTFDDTISQNIKNFSQENVIDFMNDDTINVGSNTVINTIELLNDNEIETDDMISGLNKHNESDNKKDKEKENNNKLIPNIALNNAINSTLITNNFLLDLYKETFIEFKQSYIKNQAQPSISAESLKTELQTLIDFNKILSKYYPSYDSLTFLSSVLLSEPNEPHLQHCLFTFMKKNFESSVTFNSTIFTLFTNNTIVFCSLRLDNQILAYEIFYEVFLSENFKQSKLTFYIRTKSENAIPSYDIHCYTPPNKLIGFEYMWSIIFNSKANCIMNHGLEMIYSLYHRHYLDELINRIYEQLNLRKEVKQMIALMTFIIKTLEKNEMSLIMTHKSILLQEKVIFYIISSQGRECCHLPYSTTFYNLKALLCHKRNLTIETVCISHKGTQWYSQDHIKNLYELGVQQGDEICFTSTVNIIQKPLVIQGKMTPEYEKIITSWFYIFSIDDQMNSASLADFTSTITGIKADSDDYFIKEIMSKYDIDSKGFLTIIEFNQLYLDKAINEPHYVWHSLSLMGIRNDFKEINDKNTVDIIPKQKLLRFKIANQDKWITLLFELLKESHCIEVYEFIFSLCTNEVIAKSISQGIITDDIVQNKYKMIYALYIIEFLLRKDDLNYMKSYERNDNELTELYPDFIIVKPVKKYLDLLIKENSHITLLNFYINNTDNSNSNSNSNTDMDQILLEHLIKVIKIIITKRYAIEGFDMILLFNKQLSLLSSSSYNESLMINGFEFLMHLLVFKIDNITDVISINKIQLSNLLMKGLINTNMNLKEKFGNHLITYTQLSERQSKPEIASFFFDCCFQIFHTLKTENNLDDLSFFFEYFTSMFESYSSDDNHLAFVNEITMEIKTNNKAIPKEILVGYIKILTKAMRSRHRDSFRKKHLDKQKDEVLINIIMNDIIFQRNNIQLNDIIMKYAYDDYINLDQYLNERQLTNIVTTTAISAMGNNDKETKGNNILQASFDYMVEVFKQINSDEDIKLINEFFNQRTSYESDFIYLKSSQQKNHKRKQNNHVGLINSGLICYMNSVIQQLYFIDTFRNAILQSPISSNNSDNDIMFQLKKLFANLDLSIRSAYDPKQFVTAFQAIVNNGLNVIGQQDSQEFLNSFFDVIEKNINGSQYKYIIDKMFIGKTCSMIVCDSCNHTSLGYDTFYTLSLDVSNMPDLNSSLDKYISYEIIDEFTCEGCNQKVQIKKRNLLSDLPNILIIHLKRFNLNYETCLTEKLNSRLEFQLELSIEKYCVEKVAEKQLESCGRSNDFYCKKDDCYAYTLIGAIIHRGTAEEGHYFSIVYDKKGKRWIKINDNEVCEFDIGKLGNECYGEFGGFDDDGFNDDNWLSDTNFHDNNNNNLNNNFFEGNGNGMQNAYLLFYEKKRKNDIMIIDSEDNVNKTEDYKKRIIQLNELNCKEIKRKYDKDKYDYESNTNIDEDSKTYFYIEKTKELYHMSPYDSITHSIPKDIFIEVIKDNYPLEKYFNYYDENYREFFDNVLNAIEMHIDEIEITNNIPQWISFILRIIFIYKKAITAKQLNILQKFISSDDNYSDIYCYEIIDFFANKSSADELFINENTESIELLVTLLTEVLQHTFKIKNSQPYIDSITIVSHIMCLFPHINCHFVNRIYPLYELFNFLAESNMYWIRTFIEKKFIKDIIVYIIGKERLSYNYMPNNNYWDAERPKNKINIHRLFNFVHSIIKQTKFYKDNKYISDPNATIPYEEENQETITMPLITLMDFKFFEEEDDILDMVYSYDFELYRDIIILMQTNNKELSMKMSLNISEILHRCSNKNELEQLITFIYALMKIDDLYQKDRIRLFFGYQNIYFSQSKLQQNNDNNNNFPLVGKTLNDKDKTWIKFYSYDRNHDSNIIRKIMTLDQITQVKFFIQLLSQLIITTTIISQQIEEAQEELQEEKEEYTILFDLLINFKSLNYSHPNLISYLINYISDIISTNNNNNNDDDDDNKITVEMLDSFKILMTKLTLKINSYPSDLSFNKSIPDKIKYEEIKIECFGSGLYLFKSLYYTSVYPHNQEKIDLIKHIYPFFNLNQYSNNPYITIISQSEREPIEKDFYKRIQAILTHNAKRLIVKSDEYIEYPLLTMVRYGIYNINNYDGFIKMKVNYKNHAELIEDSSPTQMHIHILGKEYQDLLILNKKDYYNENNCIDDIGININMDWNQCYKSNTSK